MAAKKTPNDNRGQMRGGGNPNFLKDVEHGRKHEASGIKAVEKCIGKIVEPKQVLHDENGKRVIPDGMIDGKPVEVKNVAPRTCNEGKDIRQLAGEKKDFPLEFVDGEPQLNKGHRDFKQVQRQIDAAGDDCCSALYALHLDDNKGKVDDEVVTVPRDQSCIDKMKAKQN